MESPVKVEVSETSALISQSPDKTLTRNNMKGSSMNSGIPIHHSRWQTVKYTESYPCNTCSINNKSH